MRAKLIINTNAGDSRGRMLPISKWMFKPQLNKHRATANEVVEAVRSECKQCGISLDIAFTEYPKHAIKIADEAKSKYDLIIAAGGDGTINEVINGMASVLTWCGIGSAPTISLDHITPITVNAKPADADITMDESTAMPNSSFLSDVKRRDIMETEPTLKAMAIIINMKYI